jgi:hypothetical protein
MRGLILILLIASATGQLEYESFQLSSDGTAGEIIPDKISSELKVFNPNAGPDEFYDFMYKVNVEDDNDNFYLVTGSTKAGNTSTPSGKQTVVKVIHGNEITTKVTVTNSTVKGNKRITTTTFVGITRKRNSRSGERFHHSKIDTSKEIGGNACVNFDDPHDCDIKGFGRKPDAQQAPPPTKPTTPRPTTPRPTTPGPTTPRPTTTTTPTSTTTVGPNGEHNPGNPYSFRHEVVDEPSQNLYSHDTNSDGENLEGEYRTLLPDGQIQVVKFEADWKNGYRAKYRFEQGPPRFAKRY